MARFRFSRRKQFPSGTGKKRAPSEVVTMDDDLARRWSGTFGDIVDADGNALEPDAEIPADADESPNLKAVGGGWYELPNGEKVHGKDAAEARVKEL